MCETCEKINIFFVGSFAVEMLVVFYEADIAVIFIAMSEKLCYADKINSFVPYWCLLREQYYKKRNFINNRDIIIFYNKYAKMND